jgi:hypothetical protein
MNEFYYNERNHLPDTNAQLPITCVTIIMTRQTISRFGNSPTAFLRSQSKTVRLMQNTRLIDWVSIRCTRLQLTPKPILILPRGMATHILDFHLACASCFRKPGVYEFDGTMTPLVLGILASIAYLAALACYRIYLHPISHIPGPKLAAFTYWYQSYYDLWPHSGRFLWKTIELHERYGPIVRIGPNEVQVNDPDYHSEIYSSGNRRREKSPLWFWMAGWSPFAEPMAGITG